MTTTRQRRCVATVVAIVVSIAPAIFAAAASSTLDAPVATTGLQAATRIPVSCGGIDPVLLGYDGFYRRHCSALGIDVLASDAVDPAAVRRTAEIIVAMIGHRPDLVESMIARDLRVGVIAIDEVTTDMPEHRDLYELFPGTDWDTRARGLGAILTIPLSSVGEENILCRADDPYVGSSIMVHEFAHTILNLGLRIVDPAFDRTQGDPVLAAWINARANGLWNNTYAITNTDEYWAETVMSYFDTNINGPVAGDGIHNPIDTRTELANYDPQICAVVDSVFRDAAPLDLCNG